MENTQQNPATGPQPTTPAAEAKAPAKPALPKDQTKSSRKFIFGCLGAFGCSIFLFLGALFAFLALGDGSNTLAKFFGTSEGELLSTLTTLTDLIFFFLVFVTFIIAIIGVFRIATAKKEDKERKQKGMMLTFGSLAAMLFLIFIGIFAHFFLTSKTPKNLVIPIATVPERTTNLTAPVSIQFDAGKASISKKFDILSYEWDFDDGTKLSGNPQTHTFKEVGNFKVGLTILAKERATGKEQAFTYEKDVTIANVIANVVIKADKKSGGAPLTANLDGSSSSSPNGEITAYAWDLDEDGEFDDGDESTAQANFDKIGTYKVSLRVTDSQGEFSIGEIELEVTPPDTPVAVITVEGTEGTELFTNTAYVFSGASSTSPTGKIEKYSWEFGDNEKAGTRTATHIYKEPGEYEVILTVIDGAKKKGETSQRFTVKAPDAPPLPSIKTAPAAENGFVSGQAPFDVIFDASGSLDPNNDIVEYAWDFDADGKTDDTNAVTSYSFKTAGTFNVKLVVTDSSNLSGETQTVVQVAAAGLLAKISADPISGVTPLTVKFDASGSTYPEGKIVSFEWDFGDGKAPRIDAASVTYQYTSIGTFAAKVTAITNDNKRASAEVSINVRPVPVKACFTPSALEGKAPLEVQFDPTCSTGTVVKYRWKFGTSGTSTDRKPKFTFTGSGEYEVALEVADNQNVVDSYTQKIIVENP